jgi:glycosyltransferase involved in cell wall biosynthesis
MATGIALIWEQFAPYHIDRIEAVGQRLAGRAEVLAVEVATASQTYDWKPSPGIAHARKATLFPGQSYDLIHPLRRFWRQWRAVSPARTVFVGIGYHQPDIVALSWLLRLTGRRVVVMTDSKFDDRPRRAWREWLKSLVLAAYSAALVAGRRQADFLRFLGFRRRPVVPGYDTVSMARIRADAGPAGTATFTDRHFVCVARLVAKKNLFTLIEVYARYVELQGASQRRLTIVGAGPLDAQLRQHCADHGVAHLVDFTGFLDPPEVSRRLAGSLALLLVSTEEQWGLVVNEAVGLGIPVIVSHAVGAGDALVRNLMNGFTFEPNAIEGVACAMAQLSSDEKLWRRMAAAAADRAWLADSARFADAVELLVFPDTATGAKANVQRVLEVLSESA